MSTVDFFSEASQQSKVKSEIVSQYFSAWAGVMLSVQDRGRRFKDKIAYIDLFAGRGEYDDGTPSTPAIILAKAIVDDRLRERLVTFFNDRDEGSVKSLSDVIGRIPGVETLRYPPEVLNYEVGEQVVEWLNSVKKVPSLVFLDPWGYKGLTLDLVDAATRDWGCDAILFFNYNRVNPALNNPYVEEHMVALFGEELFRNFGQLLDGLSPEDRELTIVEKLCDVLAAGERYVMPFRFKDHRGTRTSHHLFLVTKHHLGYEKMKEIMATESSAAAQGVASFEYNPLDFGQVKQYPLLAELSPRPLDELAEMLVESYAGKTMRMIDVYRDHNVWLPYTKRNYKDALLKLEDDGRISVPKHQKGSFGDSVEATFLER